MPSATSTSCLETNAKSQTTSIQATLGTSTDGGVKNDDVAAQLHLLRRQDCRLVLEAPPIKKPEASSLSHRKVPICAAAVPLLESTRSRTLASSHMMAVHLKEGSLQCAFTVFLYRLVLRLFAALARGYQLFAAVALLLRLLTAGCITSLL